MDKLKWCTKQSKGIRIIEPSEIIAKDYLRKADESLAMMVNSPSNEWKAVGAYYAAYEALYALLQKTGIKCEIHDCSLEMMKIFDFTDEEAKFVHFLKKQRIDAQYYVDRKYVVAQEDKVKEFVLKCKEKIETINFEEIREMIKNLLS
jgi:uncharacterized protein (UPF0332 family)